jgi:hypothetical protein
LGFGNYRDAFSRRNASTVPIKAESHISEISNHRVDDDSIRAIEMMPMETDTTLKAVGHSVTKRTVI